MHSAVTPDAFDAVLFDLHGVLTSARTLHAAAESAPRATTNSRVDAHPGLRVVAAFTEVAAKN